MKTNHPHRVALVLTGVLATHPVTAEPTRLPPGIPLPRERQQSSGESTGPVSGDAGQVVGIPQEFRSIDGRGNHEADPGLGTPGLPMIRRFPAAYADGAGQPAGSGRPSARAVSNGVSAQQAPVFNARGATDFLWQWGQFIDHDLVETPTLEPPEPFDIPVPAGDPWFDPDHTGAVTIPLNRSFHEAVGGVRQQINAITSYIDASNVYGSDETRAYALRMLDGTGTLKVTPSEHGDLLPYNLGGYTNAPDSSPVWFLAGDVRANEQAGLCAMHTLFLREHNHWAREFRDANPDAAEDETYEFARMIVGAEMQHITYQEFLPLLLGSSALPPYRGFRDDVDPTISNEFATAAYRLGHSLLSPVIRRVGANGVTIDDGDLPLAEAFFNPSIIADHGIDSLLRGLAVQRCQELDAMLVDDVRNFLFGPPGAGGFDLAALNIQRGRDHGLPSYNEVRRGLGLKPARSFRDITPDRALQRRLASAYRSAQDVDLWVGGLCEPHVPEAMVGPVFHRILLDQFIRVRDGDRYYYEGALIPEVLEVIREQSLATVIRRNTGIGDELTDSVFLLPVQQ
uniref:peroxidase family protein n=1 Tax=Luteolibacter marinus TaxID=2776705 RepID=UPI001868E668